MSFLPEDDQEFLKTKQIEHILKQEDNGKKGIIFPAFSIPANLRRDEGGSLVPCTESDVLVIIPDGYDTTRLDSFFTKTILKRPDGSLPNAAADIQDHFGEKWQFWSRHLTDQDWMQSVRGFEVYIDYIREALRSA